METEQLKILRLQSQYLLAPGPADEVVAGLIGLQAQYGANALHALQIRSTGAPDPERYVKEVNNNTGIVFPTVLYQGSERAIWKRSGYRLSIRPLGKINAGVRRRIERKAVDNFGGVAVQWIGM